MQVCHVYVADGNLRSTKRSGLLQCYSSFAGRTQPHTRYAAGGTNTHENRATKRPNGSALRALTRRYVLGKEDM